MSRQVRLSTLVPVEVGDQGSLVCELFSTEITAVFLFSSVRQDMGFEIRFRFETGLALTAVVRTLIGVDDLEWEGTNEK